MEFENTPTQNNYKSLGEFRFWCQKVLPLAYDDSLSYYELLCKVVAYLNDIIENATKMGNDVTQLYHAYQELVKWCDDYFENIDVQNEINIQLNEMVVDGTLTGLIAPLFNTYKQEVNEIVGAQNSTIGELVSRMDTFSRLEEGSTTGDAELIDARVDYFGDEHTNLGGHIREITKMLPFETSGQMLNETNGNFTDLYNTSNGLVRGLVEGIYVECEPNTVYTFQNHSLSERMFIYLCTDVPVVGATVETAPYSMEKEKTFKTNSDTKYIYIYYWNHTINPNLSREQILSTIKLEKGDKATPGFGVMRFNALSDEFTEVQGKVNKIEDEMLELNHSLSEIGLEVKQGYYGEGIYFDTYGYTYAELNVAYNEVYYLTTVSRSPSISCVICLNKDGEVIAKSLTGSGTQTNHTLYEIVIPLDCTKLIVQSSTVNEPVLYGIKTLYSLSGRYKTVKEYGVKWKIDDPTDLGTRCFDAENLHAQVGIGSANGYSDFDTIYPWSEMKRCNIRTNVNGAKIVTFEGSSGFDISGANGDVFVRVPKFCVQKYIKDGYEYRVISDTVGSVHPAFIENGEELDEIFVSAFEGCIINDKMRSIGNVTPTCNVTWGEMLSKAKANGRGYTLYDMRTVDALWTLLSVEYGCRNTNNVIGFGIADFMQADSGDGNGHLVSTVRADSTNTFKCRLSTSDANHYMPVGSNILVCKGSQANIITIAKVLSIIDDNGTTLINFDGAPINVDTDCFIGSAPIDTNFTENCPSGALSWHTGRADWNVDSRTRNPIRYRWVENVVGNLWHALPDVTFNNLQMYVCDDIDNYEIGKHDGVIYRAVGDLLPEQSDNGVKGDVLDSNYWIKTLMNDHFSKGTCFASSYDKGITARQGFGGYYYLNNLPEMLVANGGGFDHLYRCNMLTNRAWNNKNTIWYLYGGRIIYKNLK